MCAINLVQSTQRFKQRPTGEKKSASEKKRKISLIGCCQSWLRVKKGFFSAYVNRTKRYTRNESWKFRQAGRQAINVWWFLLSPVVEKAIHKSTHASNHFSNYVFNLNINVNVERTYTSLVNYFPMTLNWIYAGEKLWCDSTVRSSRHVTNFEYENNQHWIRWNVTT